MPAPTYLSPTISYQTHVTGHRARRRGICVISDRSKCRRSTYYRRGRTNTASTGHSTMFGSRCGGTLLARSHAQFSRRQRRLSLVAGPRDRAGRYRLRSRYQRMRFEYVGTRAGKLPTNAASSVKRRCADATIFSTSLGLKTDCPFIARSFSLFP